MIYIFLDFMKQIICYLIKIKMTTIRFYDYNIIKKKKEKKKSFITKIKN